MQPKIESVRDVSLNISSNGTTIVREKLITAGNIQDIISNHLIPEYGSRHPDNSRFRLQDGGIDPVGNQDGMMQFLFRGTYTTKLSSSSSSSGGIDEEDGGENTDTDPWNLGAQEFSTDTFTVSYPVRKLRKKDGTIIPFLNSANCRMSAEMDVYGTQYNFIFCVKYRESSEPVLPEQPIINSQSVMIAGVRLPAYSSLLFPPQKRLIVDRDDYGEIKRSYWEISCTIKRHPLTSGWFEDYADVGTLALDSSGKAAPVYRYFPWKSTDENANFATAPKFGAIENVIAAKNAYAKLFGSRNDADPEKKTAYWQAWQELPYDEMTEVLPLKDGKIYEEAMRDPVKYPYKEITGTTYQVGRFQQFNLPERREGHNGE